MSIFGNWGAAAPAGPSELEIAKYEADAQIDFFRRMTLACGKKCIVKHTDAELSVGEMSCIDRCSAKFMQARDIVIEVNQQAEQRMQALVKAGQAAPPKFK